MPGRAAAGILSLDRHASQRSARALRVLAIGRLVTRAYPATNPPPERVRTIL